MASLICLPMPCSLRRLGQLGLGGTYYAANGNVRNTASGFLKQAYVGFKLPVEWQGTAGPLHVSGRRGNAAKG